MLTQSILSACGVLEGTGSQSVVSMCQHTLAGLHQQGFYRAAAELCKSAQLCVFILGMQYLGLSVLRGVFRVRYVVWVLVTKYLKRSLAKAQLCRFGWPKWGREGHWQITEMRFRIFTSGYWGPWGPAPLPLPPKFFPKSCSFQAILRKKPPIWANFGLRAPLGSKLHWGPLTKILDAPLRCDWLLTQPLASFS